MATAIVDTSKGHSTELLKLPAPVQEDTVGVKDAIAHACAFAFRRDDPARQTKYLLPVAFLSSLLPDGHPLKERLNVTSLENARQKYQDFLPVLYQAARDEMEKAPDDRDPLLMHFCKQRYFGFHMTPFLGNLLKQMVEMYQASMQAEGLPSPDLFNFDHGNLASNLEILNGSIKQSPDTKNFFVRQTERFNGAVLGKDLTEQNIPFVRCEMQFGESKVIYARHPVPTLPSSWLDLFKGMGARAVGVEASNGEAIAPDFLAAINGEKVVVCAHLHIDKNVFQHETGMLEAVLELGETNPNFTAIVQPMDGSFFKTVQNPSFKESMEAIVANFMQCEHKCYLPSDLKIPEYEAKMRALLNDTHALFFKSKEIVESDEEWQLFQLYFYIMQGTDLLIQKKATVFSSFCREFADRGGIRAFVQDLVYLKMMGRLDDGEQLRNSVYNLLGTTIMIKRGPVLDWRFPLLLNAVRHLLSMDGEAFMDYRFEGGARPTDLIVQQPEGQEIPKAFFGSPSQHGPANVDQKV